jgi:hypothetical protein
MDKALLSIDKRWHSKTAKHLVEQRWCYQCRSKRLKSTSGISSLTRHITSPWKRARRTGAVLTEAYQTASVDTCLEDVDVAVSRLLSQSADYASWYGLEKLYSQAPALAQKVWQLIKDEAREEFESGHRAAQVFEPVGWLREAWRRAQYLSIRESFIEQWQPQGGIDLAMIDMLTQSYYLYLYWNEVSVTRSETEMRADPPAWIKDKMYRERDYPRERGHGYWNPPYAHEQAAVEHAAQMADRYLRAFQRTLRAMRDLRRYSSPVTINNPQQVNIAADGGQQINAIKQKD